MARPAKHTKTAAVKAERAARALQELNNAALKNGTSEMTLEEINTEIETVRKSRQEATTCATT